MLIIDEDDTTKEKEPDLTPLVNKVQEAASDNESSTVRASILDSVDLDSEVSYTADAKLRQET